MNQAETPSNPERRHFLTSWFNSKSQPVSRNRFSRIESIGEQTQGVLWAAEALAEDDITIAGDDGVIFHFNGETWQREPLGTDLPIHALCSTGHGQLYAVGWLGLICERSGGKWHYVQGGHRSADNDTEDKIRENLPLFDVATAPSGEVWAVGDQGRVTCRQDGRWQEVDCGSTANLRAVLPLADGSILISGAQGTLLHFRNNKWIEIDTQTDCHIVSMATTADGIILAVGGIYSVTEGGFVGCLFQYHEEQWSEIKTDVALPRLRRVRNEGGNLIIVGDGGAAYRWTTEGIAPLKTNLRYDLHDIVSFDQGSAIICGDGGTVLMEASQPENIATEIEEPSAHTLSWEPIFANEIKQTLRGLWAPTEDTVVAVGDAGHIIHFDGEQCLHRKAPDNISLHDIWGTSPNNLFAVGENGTIIHFDGQQWAVLYQANAAVTLLSITGFGPHDIFAVGDEGLVLRYDGLMWHRLETGTKKELYHIWGHDSNHVLVAAGGGAVLRWNGENWKTFYADTDNDLFGVWGSSLSNLVVVGISGTLVSLKDNAWHKEFSGVRTDLHAVAGIPNGPTYVVGSNGTILRKIGDQWLPEDSGVEVTLQTVAVTGKQAFAAGSDGLILRRKIL